MSGWGAVTSGALRPLLVSLFLLLVPQTGHFAAALLANLTAEDSRNASRDNRHQRLRPPLTGGLCARPWPRATRTLVAATERSPFKDTMMAIFCIIHMRCFLSNDVI